MCVCICVCVWEQGNMSESDRQKQKRGFRPHINPWLQLLNSCLGQKQRRNLQTAPLAANTLLTVHAACFALTLWRHYNTLQMLNKDINGTFRVGVCSTKLLCLLWIWWRFQPPVVYNTLTQWSKDNKSVSEQSFAAVHLLLIQSCCDRSTAGACQHQCVWNKVSKSSIWAWIISQLALQ